MSTPGWVQRTTTVPNSRSNGTTRARIVGLPRTAPRLAHRATTLPTPGAGAPGSLRCAHRTGSRLWMTDSAGQRKVVESATLGGWAGWGA